MRRLMFSNSSSLSFWDIAAGELASFVIEVVPVAMEFIWGVYGSRTRRAGNVRESSHEKIACGDARGLSALQTRGAADRAGFDGAAVRFGVRARQGKASESRFSVARS